MQVIATFSPEQQLETEGMLNEIPSKELQEQAHMRRFAMGGLHSL